MAESTERIVAKRQIADVECKAMLSVTEAAVLLGVTRPTIYRYLEKGALPFARVDAKVLIRRTDIDTMFASSLSYQARIKREPLPLQDYCRADEIVARYGIDRSYLFRVVKQDGVPKTFFRGRAYYNREHIERLFSQPPQPVEWITVEEAMVLLGVTRDALYHYIKQYAVPKEKVGRYIRISKPDILKILKPTIL